jgi:hypothetical protein
VHFREATAADRDRILALRRECFGDVDPEKADPRFWHWEFERARMFVGEEGDALASHLALLDVPYVLDGRVVDGALAVDAMTAPSARGRGAFTKVVQQAMSSSTHTVATAYQIRSAVLGAMLRGGWAIATRVPVLVRPAITFQKRQAGLAIGHYEPWMSELAERDGAAARSAEFIRWRFFENPRWSYRVTGIEERAYLVTRKTKLKGFDTLAIVDLAWRDRRAAKVLLRDAIVQARSEHCQLVAALVSRRHPAFGMLLRHGFLPGPHWFRLLVHPHEHASRPWRVMWADTDHL